MSAKLGNQSCKLKFYFSLFCLDQPRPLTQVLGHKLATTTSGSQSHPQQPKRTEKTNQRWTCSFLLTILHSCWIFLVFNTFHIFSSGLLQLWVSHSLQPQLDWLMTGQDGCQVEIKGILVTSLWPNTIGLTAGLCTNSINSCCLQREPMGTSDSFDP